MTVECSLQWYINRVLWEPMGQMGKWEHRGGILLSCIPALVLHGGEYLTRGARNAVNMQMTTRFGVLGVVGYSDMQRVINECIS